MAAPALIPIVIAVLSAIWTGLVSFGKWALEHAHVVKVAVVCLILIAAFRAGLAGYAYVMELVNTYVTEIQAATPNGGGSFSLDLLAKANYCLPVSEMLALLAVYITLAGLCMGLKFLISLWRNVPFKNA